MPCVSLKIEPISREYSDFDGTGLKRIYENYGPVNLVRFVNDIDKSPIKFERVLPTPDTLEYSEHHGKLTLVKSTWHISIGHDFGRALVVMGTEEGAQKAIENLDGYALDGSIVYVSRAQAHMSESQTSQVFKVDGNKIHKDP